MSPLFTIGGRSWHIIATSNMTAFICSGRLHGHRLVSARRIIGPYRLVTVVTYDRFNRAFDRASTAPRRAVR